MLKTKGLIFCFFFIFSFASSIPVNAMDLLEEVDGVPTSGGKATVDMGGGGHENDEEGDWGSLANQTTTFQQNDVTSPQSLVSLPDIGTPELDNLFTPIVKRVPIPTPQRKVFAGITGGCTALVWSTVAIPFFMEFFKYLGATDERVPPGSAGAIGLNVSAALMPATVGFSAAYEVVALHQWERPTIHLAEVFSALIWMGAIGNVIWGIESNVNWYGGAFLWQVVFTALVVLPIAFYFLYYKGSTHKVNKTPSHLHTKTEKKKEAILSVVKGAERGIIDNEQKPEVTRLEETLMVLERVTPSIIPQEGSGSFSSIQLLNSPLIQEEGDQHSDTETIEPSPQQMGRGKLKYLTVFEQMHAIPKGMSSSWLDRWDPLSSEIAKWANIPVQAAAMPMKVFASYFLSNQFFGGLCKVPQEVSRWLSAATTVFPSFPLIFLSSIGEGDFTYKKIKQWLRLCMPESNFWQILLSSVGEGEFTYKEIKQLLRLYMPESNFWRAPWRDWSAPQVCYFFARWLASVSGRFGSASLAVPIALYARDIILQKLIANGYSGVANALIVPFGFVLYSFFGQFNDYHLTNFVNWVATGAPAFCCKLLPWIDRNDKRKNTLEVARRVQGIDQLVFNLNKDKTQTLHSELVQLGIIQADETNSLL